MFGNLGLSFLAGALSILSPCVLPLLPIVLGTAASQGKYSPVVLGFGVVLSFVSVGLFVALVGFSIGLDGGFFRSIAAAVLVLIGVVLLVPNFQSWFALVAAPMSGWRNSMHNFSLFTMIAPRKNEVRKTALRSQCYCSASHSFCCRPSRGAEGAKAIGA